jgi:hypothetical protein
MKYWIGYEVRIYPKNGGNSRSLGYRVIRYHRAKRVVAWLKKRGVDAVYLAMGKVQA